MGLEFGEKSFDKMDGYGEGRMTIGGYMGWLVHHWDTKSLLEP